MTPICFLDTETDGVHPGRRPWEIAIIRRDDEGEQEWSAFVEIDLSTADPFGLRVGRFYDRHPTGRSLTSRRGDVTAHPADRPTPISEKPALVTREQAAHAVARLTHGAHIVGAVPNFDTETLDPLLRFYELAPAWHYHLIDIEALAVGYVLGRTPGPAADPAAVAVAPPWKSEDLSRAIGVEPASEEERHTAMGDVRWVMRMYDAVVGGSRG